MSFRAQNSFGEFRGWGWGGISQENTSVLHSRVSGSFGEFRGRVDVISWKIHFFWKAFILHYFDYSSYLAWFGWLFSMVLVVLARSEFEHTICRTLKRFVGLGLRFYKGVLHIQARPTSPTDASKSSSDALLEPKIGVQSWPQGSTCERS